MVCIRLEHERDGFRTIRSYLLTETSLLNYTEIITSLCFYIGMLQQLLKHLYTAWNPHSKNAHEKIFATFGWKIMLSLLRDWYVSFNKTSITEVIRFLFLLWLLGSSKLNYLFKASNYIGPNFEYGHFFFWPTLYF